MRVSILKVVVSVVVIGVGVAVSYFVFGNKFSTFFLSCVMNSIFSFAIK